LATQAADLRDQITELTATLGRLETKIATLPERRLVANGAD
jgi:hypothetical protein